MAKKEFTEKFYEISFSHKISKEAYLKACKWLAKNVYSKAEFSEYIRVQIKKDTERQLPTFTVTLYVSANEKEMKTEYCGKCKSLHTIMYSVDKPDCQTCKMEGYRKYMESHTANFAKFWKEVFENEETL